MIGLGAPLTLVENPEMCGRISLQAEGQIAAQSECTGQGVPAVCAEGQIGGESTCIGIVYQSMHCGFTPLIEKADMTATGYRHKGDGAVPIIFPKDFY